jgi:hypothetical protein
MSKAPRPSPLRLDETTSIQMKWSRLVKEKEFNAAYRDGEDE